MVRSTKQHVDTGSYARLEHSGWLETTWYDLRYGVRQLGKAPVLAAVAVLSLALGVGANTAIFTLIDTVMLRSLPVRDPGHLVLFNDDISTGVSSGEDLSSGEFPILLFNTFSRTMTRS